MEFLEQTLGDADHFRYSPSKVNIAMPPRSSIQAETNAARPLRGTASVITEKNRSREMGFMPGRLLSEFVGARAQ